MNQPPDGYALAPLTTYCDRHPAMVAGFRVAGQWHIRIGGVTGVAVQFEAAVADAMNKLMSDRPADVARETVRPDCGRCNGTGEIGEGHRLQTCPVCRGSGLGTVAP